MSDTDYSAFALEACKITLFCIVVTGIFKLLGASNNTLLIVFNMAVMSSAATFSVEKKHLRHVVLGSSVIVLSIVIGGILGYYFPLSAKLLTILYAGLAFYLPKVKYKTNIFVTGSVMFLIFTALPFTWRDGAHYAVAGLLVAVIFVIFYFLFERTRKTEISIPLSEQQSHRYHITAIVAVVSLILAEIISYFLSVHFQFSHLYWIGLTALVVIQSSQRKTIQTSFKRILVNTAGALITVGLFGYLIPPEFWINLAILILFLFLIFFLGFSYTGRTLFIELFVLGFTHLLGSYHNVFAYDRVILTLIGGFIVIISTSMIYFIDNQCLHKNP